MLTKRQNHLIDILNTEMQPAENWDSFWGCQIARSAPMWMRSTGSAGSGLSGQIEDVDIL